MQLKIEGRNKLGQLKMVVLHADTITDNEVRNALQMVGYPLSNLPQGYDVLASTGVKDQVGTYITDDDLQFAKDQARINGYTTGEKDGYERGKKEGAKPCRRKHVSDVRTSIQEARSLGHSEGYNAGFAAALPPGHVAYSDAEIKMIRREAFERGQAHAQEQGGTPHNFPIPADVWYGKHYGEFVTISGFANDSIPGASENGYLTKRVYVRKDDITTPGTYTLPPMMRAPLFDPTNEVQCREAQKMHDKLLDDGYVPALVIELR